MEHTHGTNYMMHRTAIAETNAQAFSALWIRSTQLTTTTTIYVFLCMQKIKILFYILFFI
jgi:hypothetical protein